MLVGTNVKLLIYNIMAKKQNFIMSITQSDFDATINARNVIVPDYIVQEKAILMVVAACPGFTLEEIIAKASIINDLYSTSVFDILSVAKHIYSVSNTTGLLDKNGNANPSAITAMAKVSHGGKTIHHISFASKFASFFRPDLFPIYDSLVAEVFCRLKSKGFFKSNTSFTKDDLKSKYSTYKAVYDEFMDLSGMSKLKIGASKLTYKNVDDYLWTSRKVYLAKHGKNKAKVDLTNVSVVNTVLNNIINTSI